MKKNFNKDIIIFLFIFLVIAGKAVRYTAMKVTLVDEGIGHTMIKVINSKKTSFGLTFGNADTSDSVSANDNATFIFSLINFFNLDTYQEFEVYISIIWNLILFILLLNMKKHLDTFQTIFVCASIAILNIFDFCLAKEPIQMLFFLLIYIILLNPSIKSNKVKYMLCIGVILLSTILFRIYYILIAMFMILITIVMKNYLYKKNKINKKDIIYILVGITIFYCLFLIIAKNFFTTEYNELIRVRLRTSTAASDMRAIFKSENLLIFSIDYLIMIVRMLIPIELIKLGPKYLLYVGYQMIITYLIIRNIVKYKEISENRKISLYIYLAFLFASATFEPDFGSWIRHEAVIFPVLLILDGITEIKNKKDKERESYLIGK